MLRKPGIAATLPVLYNAEEAKRISKMFRTKLITGPGATHVTVSALGLIVLPNIGHYPTTSSKVLNATYLSW
ncbi:MAG TPA: hypothetical protein PK198_03180 [Saprospiraceae bacterium]|nr:hypothetical protein [Saprospiraceae bacterium]